MSRAIVNTLGVVALLFASGAVWLSAAPTAQVTPPSDGILKDRIEYRFETSGVLRKYDLDAKVDKGVATISGSVATEQQKLEAEKLAKVEGISRVQNDVIANIEVDRTLADRAKSGLSKTGETITDAWIITKVKWFLLGEDLLKGSDINVDAKNKVVTLKGTVKTEAARARAIALARDTEGVERLVDQLTVGG